MGTKVWTTTRVLILTLAAGCGSADDAAEKVGAKAIKSFLEGPLDGGSRFTAQISPSPLRMNSFHATTSMVTIGDAESAASGLSRRIEIKSGFTTIRLGDSASNQMQGVAITLYRWEGEKIVPVLNPDEAPADGGAFAVVAYSEIRRDLSNADRNVSWFTVRSTDGVVHITDFNVKEGISGAVQFHAWLQPLDAGPEPVLVQLKGSFNVNTGGAADYVK